MKKPTSKNRQRLNKALTTTTGRTLMYLTIFIVGSALHELLFRLVHPTIWSNTSLLLTLLTLVAFVLVGVLFASEGHAKSRVTSAATLLILAFIALRLGHSVVADQYLLVAALAVAAIGALPVLHHRLNSNKKTALHILLAAGLSVVVAVTFAYLMAALDRTAL